LESSYEKKGNSMLSILKDDINYCLDVLRLDNPRDEEIETKVKKLLYAQDTAFFSTYHKRLLALKVIADFVTVTSNPLSRSQLYDFLKLSTAALSSEGMKEHKMLQETTNAVIFKIYGDLIENYQIANDILRLNYPQIIVDVVAVLSRGIDMSGKEVSVYRVYNYYLSRKSQPISNFTSLHISNIMSDAGKNSADYDTRNNDLVQTLVRITGRNDRD
jgi:hypothetical protein